MKKLNALLLGCLLSVSLTALGGSTEADQKWLEAVQKIVAKGETKVSTPSETRVNLLKEWGTKMGYSINVTKTETSYNLQVSKSLAKD